MKAASRVWLAALAACLGACQELPNVAPLASFIYTPLSPIVAGQTAVTFNAAASVDSDGRIVSYIWNFGDATPELNLSGPTTSHVFPNTPATCIEITYVVLLTVQDESGARAFASQNVTVREDCPR